MRNWKRVVCLLLVALAGQPALAARTWERLEVPGGRCGDGTPYEIYISRKDPTKIAFDFMGGGACWSLSTCLGPAPLAWIHPIPGVFENLTGGILSDDSPLKDHTVVYFPYCTGDVHFGRHVAKYKGGFKVWHYGRINIENAIRLLTEQKQVDLEHARNFVLYGYSAGSLGAIAHSPEIFPLLRPDQDKTLILDAPGLHFGDGFWKKFPAEMLADFSSALTSIGYVVAHDGSGDLAYLVPPFCELHRDWKIGILQGADDIIMASLFGTRTPYDHEAAVFGENGLYKLTEDPTDNCASWVPKSAMHTFLVTNPSSKKITAGGKSAIEFATEIIERGPGSNYR